jgi:hypothetical protein
LQKWNIFARKHQIKKCLIFRCRHAVLIMQILNWTNQCWLFMTVRYIMRSVRMTMHPRTVSHARDYWWTLDFANAFVSPGVNSLAELVPSHAASRRWLGDKMHDLPLFSCKHSKCFNSRVATVSDRMHTDSISGMPGSNFVRSGKIGKFFKN